MAPQIDVFDRVRGLYYNIIQLLTFVEVNSIYPGTIDTYINLNEIQ